MSEETTPESKCMYPECDKPILGRGLCKNHYTYATALVREKKTTWEELISKGKCKDKCGRKSTSWFLS